MIYFVTDKKNLSEEAWLECMMKRIEEGVDFIIIRDKGHFDVQAVKDLISYKRQHANSKTKILIHSQLELAKELDADGVHLPYALWKKYKEEQGEMLRAWHENKLIGLSIHEEAEAKAADGDVDYMLLSPIFAPSCKPIEGKGIKWFKEIQEKIGTPLVALGGITAQNIQVLHDEEIYDIAVMSYLMDMCNKIKDLQ